MTSMRTLAKELGTDAKSLAAATGVDVVAETQELNPEQEEQVRQTWAQSQSGDQTA